MINRGWGLYIYIYIYVYIHVYMCAHEYVYVHVSRYTCMLIQPSASPATAPPASRATWPPKEPPAGHQTEVGTRLDRATDRTP